MVSPEAGDCYFYTKSIRALRKLSFEDCLQCAGLDLRFQATWFSKLQVDIYNIYNSIFVSIAVFVYVLYSFTKVKANTVSVRAQASILRSSGHSVKEIAKLLKKIERCVNN